MSVVCSEITDSVLLEKVALYGAKRFVYANIDAKTRAELPFPSDYEFLPCFLPKKYEKLSNRIQNFKVRPNDIWVVSFPKAGTTWIYNIVHQMRNNLDFSANFVPTLYGYFERAILFENQNNDDDFECFINEVHKDMDNFDEDISPRVIKSHLPAHLLPQEVWTVKPKIIYVHRNAKDVSISMYHMFRNHKYIRLGGSIEEHFENFLNGHVTYSSYHAHVNSFLQLQQMENFLLIKYEDMADSIDGIKKINDFLDYSYSDNQLIQLAEHCSFDNMRKKQRFNTSFFPNFFRKGKAGGYQDEMSPEYIERFDQWKV
ncbi:sulfotransferase 1E1-like [Sitodiplosis mosellana]|uniref:sulfotransferase 1E1-like n=1 Tax=Sitodiplosis mosellana TaxID=263140 RepID=UPI0024450652|nr:sulfotransferase 1E1-like [Sitodiplosis mosellana]